MGWADNAMDNDRQLTDKNTTFYVWPYNIFSIANKKLQGYSFKFSRF